MPNVAVYNTQGQQTGSLELSEVIFGAEVRTDLMHQVVVAHLANKRQGTHKTKTRGEVNGGGIKPYRQKGTGNARQGSRRAPNWPGGGVVFGPVPRSYALKVPKKVKRLALYSALSDKVNEEKLFVLDTLALDTPKTKEIVSILGALNVNGKALIVTAGNDVNVFKSANNIPGVDVLEASGPNVYDILNHGVLVATKDAVSRIEEVFA